MAMGYNDVDAACALRVSLGTTTSEEKVMTFVKQWTSEYKKFIARQGANV